MRYRNIVNNKLDILENDLRTLEQIVQRQLPVQEYLNTLERTKENLENVRNLISLEPITNDEVAQ